MIEQDADDFEPVHMPTVAPPASTQGPRTDVCRAFRGGTTADTTSTCQRCGEPFHLHDVPPKNRDVTHNGPHNSVLVERIAESGTYTETLGFGCYDDGTPVAFVGDSVAMDGIARWLEWNRSTNAKLSRPWPLMAFVRRADIVVEGSEAQRDRRIQLVSAVYTGPRLDPLPEYGPLLRTGQGLIVALDERKARHAKASDPISVVDGWADPTDDYAHEDWGDRHITDIPLVDLVLNSNWRTRAR
jgi:hypothetical protein